MTQVDTNKHLIESGNKNILQNPSFESLLEGGSIPYWSYGSPSPVQEESSTVIDGKKLAVFSVSSEPILLTQSSTLYANAFADGVQGLVSVRVKSDVALKVCSISAGTTSTSNCVDVLPDNKWGLYKVPTILGATSNGISIASSGNVTGTAYIDDAFVGPVDLSATQSFDTICDTIACSTEFSVHVQSNGVVNSENLDWITTCTNVSGRVICNFTSEMTLSLTAGMHCIGNRAGSSGGTATVLGGYSSTTGFNFTSGNTTSNNTIYYCQKQGADYASAIQAQKDYEKTKMASYSSTNADTNPISYTPTLGLTGATVTSKWERKGGKLKVVGHAVWGGGATGTTLTVSIPSGLTIDTSKLPTTDDLILGKVGGVDSGVNRIGGWVKYNDTTTVLIMAKNATTYQYQNVTPVTPFTIATNDTYTWDFEVPIVGWENSNLIIGQFSGLESCSTDSYECTDTFSAQVSSTGVVSGENIDWINGNCSVSNGYICNFNSGIFTTTPSCATSLINSDNNAKYHKIKSVSSSAVTGFTSNTGSGFVAFPLTIVCQKAGADYIGKTAKAVASDQNLRTPGLTKGVVYSALISSTGVVSNDNGDFINGNCLVSGTAVFTCPIISGKFEGTPVCTVSPNWVNFLVYASMSTATTKDSVQYRTSNYTGVAQAANATLICHGVSQ
jgi:hypothetical protein